MNIKNLIFTFVIGTFVLMANACTTKEKEPKPSPKETPVIEIDNDDITVPSAGKTFILDVKCTRTITVKSSAEEWCHCTLMHDAATSATGSLKIVVDASTEKVVREAIVTLSAEGCKNVAIKVTQDHKALSSDCGISAIAITKSLNPALVSDIEFKFDQTAGTFSAIYLKWIEGTNPEMLKPSITHEGELLINGEKVADGSAISFADDFTIVSKAEDGTEKTYKVSLNCPQINRELAVLHMKPSKLIADKDNYVDTDILLYDKTPGATEGEGWWDSAEKGAIQMRGRGNSTWPLPKKPFRMKFTEKFSPIGLNHAKEKSWVILSQDMDKSLIRTHLAFEYSRILFNASEGYHHEKCLNFTPISKFINVYLTGDYYDSAKKQTIKMNGDYLGVYQMSDQMERADGRIAVDKLKASDGSDPEKISGGYIIETDLHEGNHYTSKKRIKMTYKYPKDDDFDQSQYDYITNFLNNAETALYGNNYKDPANGWRKYFDEKTLADFIIIKEFVGDLDGYTSTYMYKRRGYDKIFFGPIWDCDKGWDNDKRVPHSEYKPLESLMIHAGFWMPQYVNNDWFQRLWTDETFRAFVAKRWAAKKEELKAVTDKVLTNVPHDMAKAIEANFTVWPFNYQHNSEEARMPAKDYPSEIQRIRDKSAAREVLLDRLFNQ